MPMIPELNKILEGAILPEFAERVGKPPLSELSAEEFVRAAAEALAPGLYREDYNRQLPYSLCVLLNALELGAFLGAGEKKFPVLQALWYAGEEEKNPDGTVPNTDEVFSPEVLSGALAKGFFQKVSVQVNSALASPENFSAAKKILRAWAYRDIANMGYKLIYLDKVLRALETFPGLSVSAAAVLFPPLHYLVHGPCDKEYHGILLIKLGRVKNELGRFLGNREILAEEEFKRLQRVVIYQFPAVIIENFVYELQKGISPDQLFQITLAAACQSLFAAYKENWIYPVHAYHYAHAAWNCFSQLEDADDKIALCLMAPMVVNKMAVKSLNSTKPIRMEELDIPAENLSVEGLCQAIEASRPEQAGAIAYRLWDRREELGLEKFLVLMACKNDALVSRGQGMQFCAHLLKDASRVDPPVSRKLFGALAYFLAQLEQDYDLSRALGW